MGYARQIAPNTVGVGGLVFRGGYFDTQTNLPRLADLDQWGVSLKVDYDFGWSTLTSTTAYRSVRNFSNTDQDSGPLRFVDVQIDERTKTAQQEFLLHGDVGRLDWTAGVFLFRSKASVVPFQIRSGLIPAQNIDRFSEMRTNSVAGFAQGTYHLTDTTSLTAGLRYTSDERKIYGTQITGPGNPAGAGVVTGRRNPSIDPTAKKTFDKLTWRLSLDQKVNDDVLVYASYNRGFKSGIFNTAGPFDPVVAPETLDAYEVGVKSDLLDRHLRLNASAFHYIYKDIQLQVPVVGGSVALNAAKGRINGFDIDATASLPMSVGSFEVRTGFSYLDARYRDFPNAPFSVQSPAVCTPTPMQLPGARTGGSTTCIGNASGNRMIRSPKYTITVSADYTHPIGSGEGYLNLSYYYNGGFQWEIDNLHPEPSYDLVNGQIGFRPASRVWDVRFYARNILNKRYFQQFATSSLSDTVLAGEPRSYGVTLSFKLGK
jgi:iron complex outermembrane receptor protein